MTGTITDVFLILGSVYLMTAKTNSSDFDHNNVSESDWLDFVTSDDCQSSEEYMGYPVGYIGPVFN